jgi:hypothetical protein
MTDLSTHAHREHPWRILLLDRDPADPKWLLATVTLPTDVRPAVLDPVGRYSRWAEVTAWVHGQLGHAVDLVPVHDGLAWRVDHGPGGSH